MANLVEKALQYVTKQCNQLDPHTQKPKYSDVPSFLSDRFSAQEKMDAHAVALRGLELNLIHMIRGAARQAGLAALPFY